jgi:hypothetical protein
MNSSKSILKALAALTVVLMVLAGCTSTPSAPAGPIVVEAEATAYTGDIVVNGDPDDGTAQPITGASGDMLYLRSEGEIPFVFDVPAAGEYLIKIIYAVPNSYGAKNQDVYVNGELVGNLEFPATGEPAEFAEKWVGIVALEPGETTVTIVKSWGYTWFDYASIEIAE